MNILRKGLFAVAAFGCVYTASMAIQPAQAESLKCKPRVHVTNNLPEAIKVVRFLYKVAGDTTERSEGLTNKRLAPGETEDWEHQTLAHAATGIVVTETAVVFKRDNSGAGDGWGAEVESKWFPHSFTCNDSHNYNHVVP